MSVRLKKPQKKTAWLTLEIVASESGRAYYSITLEALFIKS